MPRRNILTEKRQEHPGYKRQKAPPPKWDSVTAGQKQVKMLTKKLTILPNYWLIIKKIQVLEVRNVEIDIENNKITQTRPFENTNVA